MFLSLARQLSARTLRVAQPRLSVVSSSANRFRQFSIMAAPNESNSNGYPKYFVFEELGNDVFRAISEVRQRDEHGGLRRSSFLPSAGRRREDGRSGIRAQRTAFHVHFERRSSGLQSASPPRWSQFLHKDHQNGKIVFTCQISFHVKEEGAVSHSIHMPDVPPPEELISDAEGCKIFIQEEKEAKREIPKMQLIRMIKRVEELEGEETLFEMRPTDLDAFFALKPMVLQPFHFWFKCPKYLPDDPMLHRWLVSYITDSTLVSAAYRPHVSRGFVPSMMFSLDHSVWIHDSEFRADEWMLYEVSSTIAKNGRALVNAKFWTRDGRLVMTAVQECLIRSRDGFKNMMRIYIINSRIYVTKMVNPPELLK
ncbi:hypothetical protein L596_002783 [Steinernema carpocapsae]|uniref:Acyl-CoA thioesterase 2 C-terminal domain-containing protein n=1 Tax=Steinernema carpocapsae TaxID=34508 RepID=A0A4U8UQK8_STECR|nr:hypothetical protein L596_002783 [Steinernema carpocapsae]